MRGFKTIGLLVVLGILLGTILKFSSIPFLSKKESLEKVPTFLVTKRSFPIHIRTVGELEAARSISIASNIRGDQAKIIDIIADGTHVNTGDLLVKIDPTPFEKKVEELKGKVVECEGQLETLAQAVDWEIEQAEHDNKSAVYELESAAMELIKVVKGDGPLEIARLKSNMQKAEAKYHELSQYSNDLVELEQQGFLNPLEIFQTQKKIQEEKEAYENAKMQYDSFVEHVHPMLVKKAKAFLKRVQCSREETERAGNYRIKKAYSAFTQGQQQLQELQRQYGEAVQELEMTQIDAPSPGMVVLKEEYRSSQKRKPRVGDVLVRNQTILDLPDLSQLVVKTKVREIDLYKVEVGKRASLEVDAYPHLNFEGTISFIGILALNDLMRPGDEKNYEVKIVVDQSNSNLKPGMTTRAVIQAGSVENSLAVPIHAVFEQNKEHYCYILQGDLYRMQRVKLGMSNEHWVQILDGLEENCHISLTMPPETHIVGDSNAQ